MDHPDLSTPEKREAHFDKVLREAYIETQLLSPPFWYRPKHEKKSSWLKRMIRKFIR